MLRKKDCTWRYMSGARSWKKTIPADYIRKSSIFVVGWMPCSPCRYVVLSKYRIYRVPLSTPRESLAVPTVPARITSVNRFAGFFSLVKDFRCAHAAPEASLGACNQCKRDCTAIVELWAYINFWQSGEHFVGFSLVLTAHWNINDLLDSYANFVPYPQTDTGDGCGRRYSQVLCMNNARRAVNQLLVRLIRQRDWMAWKQRQNRRRTCFHFQISNGNSVQKTTEHYV